MKQLVLALVTTFAIGTAAAQSPQALVAAKGGVTVQTVVGNAKIGDRTIPANNSVGAEVGDVVVVTEGSAKVTYGNGCSVTVTAEAPHTIADRAPECRAPVKMASTDAKYYWGAAGAVLLLGGVAASGGGDDKPSSP